MTDPADPGAARAVLAIEIQGAEFGLPLDSVEEVVRVPAVTRLPFPPPAVRGVAGLRGEVVPVLDLALRLLGRSSPEERRLVVVRDPAGERVGLLVEHVHGIVEVDPEGPEPPPEVHVSLPPGWIEAVVAPSPDRLLTILRLGPVLAVDETASKERT